VNVELIADTGLYSVDSILGAAYVFVDRCYVFLDRLADGRVRISLTAKPGTSSDTFGEVAGEFQNELLAQTLRQQIAARHGKVREAIVARALFGAAPELPRAPTDVQLGLDAQYLPAGNDDFLDDPLGIAVPWEEKYGKAPAGGASGTTPAEEAPAGGAGRER
jgi:His-Xaa-Ser system protein HxsD